jgi:hypothetical protein
MNLKVMHGSFVRPASGGFLSSRIPNGELFRSWNEGRRFSVFISHSRSRPLEWKSMQTMTLQDRLAKFAARARHQLAEMPDGPERERLIKTIRRVENASELEVWVGSPQSGFRSKPERPNSV